MLIVHARRYEASYKATDTNGLSLVVVMMRAAAGPLVGVGAQEDFVAEVYQKYEVQDQG
jgi:hypothetical protein